MVPCRTIIILILALAACTKSADVSTRRSDSAQNSGSTGTDGTNTAGGNVSGAVTDDDFTQALEPTSVSGTNLAGDDGTVTIAWLDTAGAAWRDAGTMPITGARFKANGLPRDKYLRFR